MAPMVYRAALVCTLATSLAFARAQASELVVVIRGLESSAGEVEVAVYGEAQRATFPYAERGNVRDLRVRASDLQGAGKFVSVGDLAPGRYAVSVIHDANANGDIDLNLFGFPLESYGFSNGVRPLVRPPTFDDAAVPVADKVTRIEIGLRR